MLPWERWSVMSTRILDNHGSRPQPSILSHGCSFGGIALFLYGRGCLLTDYLRRSLNREDAMERAKEWTDVCMIQTCLEQSATNSEPSPANVLHRVNCSISRCSRRIPALTPIRQQAQRLPRLSHRKIRLSNNSVSTLLCESRQLNFLLYSSRRSTPSNSAIVTGSASVRIWVCCMLLTRG